MQETQVRSLGQEYPVEEGMETHSTIFAWRIPWTEKPGGLWPMGSQRVGHDWRDLEQQQWRGDLRILRCHICLIFIFWLCHAAYGILAPRPGIEPKPPALEGETLTTGLPVKSRLHPLNLDNFFGRYWSPFKSRTVYFLICFSNIPHHGWRAIYENEWVKSNT